MFTTIARQTLTNYYKDNIHVITCQTLPASVDKTLDVISSAIYLFQQLGEEESSI